MTSAAVRLVALSGPEELIARAKAMVPEIRELAEETERNLRLALAEFRNYQRGVMPAGPGARELTALRSRIRRIRPPCRGASPGRR